MAKPTKTSAKQSKPKAKRRRKKPAAISSSSVKPNTKTALLVEMLSDPKGATLDALVKKIGWQPHSVRGAISGTVKKKLGLTVTSVTEKGRGRVYRIVTDP
jgi:Protein of unknown function (DUF3489)